MPSRFVSLAILIYWSIAAFLLLTWDVIPELTQGYPPNLRAIARRRRFDPGRCGGASRSWMTRDFPRCAGQWANR